MLPRTACLVLAGLLLPSTAGAENKAVSVGILGSFGRHARGPASTGVGAEATYNWFPGGICRYGIPCDGLFVGGVAQAQTVSFDHARFMLGVQGGDVYGVELGPSVETSDGVRATTVGLHVAPFISLLGVVSAAVRMGVPLTTFGASPGYALDVALVLTLKLPLSAL